MIPHYGLESRPAGPGGQFSGRDMHGAFSSIENHENEPRKKGFLSYF